MAYHHPFDYTDELLLLDAIVNYQTLHGEKQESANAIRARLAHLTDFLVDTGRTGATCADVDEHWATAFRAWAAARPIISPKGIERQRTLSTI